MDISQGRLCLVSLGVPATTAPLLKELYPPTSADKVDLPGRVYSEGLSPLPSILD